MSLYQSKADLPYYSKLTQTKFELIKIDSLKSSEISIIVAKDNDTVKYILIAPNYLRNQTIKDLSDVDLNHAITILPDKSKELLMAIDYSLKNWSKEVSPLTGVNIEYVVYQEQKMPVLSGTNIEDIVYKEKMKLALKYNYQNNIDGPLSVIIIGEGMAERVYKIDSIGELRFFYNTLKTAIGKL
jgi:hypothetical protein